jgi:murein DD-endopeptidase MepM/ murein hydrolase activator NlpD
VKKTKLYTVMVVPHQGENVHSFAVTRPFVLTMGILLLGLVMAGAVFPNWYLEDRWQEQSLAALRQHNADLTEDLRAIDHQLVALRTRMEHYEREARKFALMAGLEQLPEEMEATGGAQDDGPLDLISRDESLWMEIDALSSREERLERNFAALSEAYAEREAYLASIPTISPVAEGYFGSSFGWRRDPFNGRRVFHRGQDIVAATGTPIVAPAAGKVTRAGRSGGLGLAVYISHGHRVVSRFGHLSQIKVKRGQKVERGEVIGLVGSTGRSMGSHLHYEVLVADKHVDPRDFILEEPAVPSS